MPKIDINGSLNTKTTGPEIYAHLQPNGQPWASLADAHNIPTYKGITHRRFVDDGSGLKEYHYVGGTNLENLVLNGDAVDLSATKNMIGLRSYVGSDVPKSATKGFFGLNANMQEPINTLLGIGDSLMEEYGSTAEGNGWFPRLCNMISNTIGNGFVRVSMTNNSDPTKYPGYTFGGSVTNDTISPVGASRILNATGWQQYSGGKVFRYVDVTCFNDAPCTLTFSKNGTVYRTKQMPAGLCFSYDGTPTASTSTADVYRVTCTAGSARIVAFHHFNGLDQPVNCVFQSDAHAGYSSADVVTNLPYIISQYGIKSNCPVTAVLAIGTNDMYSPTAHTNAATFGANLDIIFAALVSLPKSGVVYIFPSKASSAWPVLVDDYEDYHTIALAKAVKYGVTVVDLSGYDAVTPGNLLADGLHYNDLGHSQVANIIGSILGGGSPLATNSVGGGSVPPDTITDIGNTSVDLDTYTGAGVFQQKANTFAASGSNYPVPLAGILRVRTNISVLVFQDYTSYLNGYYTRVLFSGTWSPWIKLADTSQIKSIQIITTENLDTLITNGEFACESDAFPSPSLNYPENISGILTVKTSSGPFVYQTYHTYTNKFYTRSIFSGTKTAWVKLTP